MQSFTIKTISFIKNTSIGLNIKYGSKLSCNHFWELG